MLGKMLINDFIILWLEIDPISNTYLKMSMTTGVFHLYHRNCLDLPLNKKGSVFVKIGKFRNNVKLDPLHFKILEEVSSLLKEKSMLEL